MDTFTKIHTLEEFEQASHKKSIFLFTAQWCPDCLFFKPFIGEITKENPEFSYYVVDRDELIDLCIDLQIMGIPSFIAFDKGEETGRLVNKLRKTKSDIQSFIDAVK